ncbi:flagellar basal body P-ring formation chaperone FlgA [Sphingomonas sp. BK580]|uniref:flagellar basal body P-ring formation chaperone FlgA n=1 Tax=Sphingomonas sp. BK580 TaxID=2586972 RepID=UPI001613ED5D|nr:flagellar basal body P-ring formation chaperone FlgA [Sphingomonas sp. BK580]MBB3692763.1 flagella basal body P-ring formation protein FlgA [Sphingomonas sp. BK580]
MASGPAVAQSGAPATTVVLAQPVAAGAVIGVDDLRAWGAGDPPPMRGALAAANIVGRAAARRLAAGAVVRAGDVRAPQVIRRGEPVTVVLRSGALTISAEGQALNAAALGEPVRVICDSTRRTVSGRAEAPGRVIVAG